MQHSGENLGRENNGRTHAFSHSQEMQLLQGPFWPLPYRPWGLHRCKNPILQNMIASLEEEKTHVLLGLECRRLWALVYFVYMLIKKAVVHIRNVKQCPIYYIINVWLCKKGPGWNDPMTAVVPRVKGFACYDLSFSRHNKNIKMEHFFLYILSRYFIWLHKMKRVLMMSVHH